jgi:DNA-binding HxlR family transcriptional regulator
MRSYEQYCAVARALDVVGDRWSLLIVRELILRGSCRYTDLRYGLPGIATNLLADRLRELEEAGIVAKVDAPPPIATTLYELTPRGRELGPVLQSLGRWGSSLMATAHEGDQFRSHWLAFPISRLVDATPGAPPVTIQLRTGDEPMIVDVSEGSVRARPGTAEEPDAVIAGSPDVVVGVLVGRLELAKAKRRGLKFEGDVAALERIRPQPVA